MTRRSMMRRAPREHSVFRDYTVEAKATVYGGVTFRSRLEARWAAFFDEAGMPWEYEPVRLDGWVPDFRLFGQFLCEVKPIDMTGFGVVNEQYDWIKKTIRNERALIFGSRPSDFLACMVRFDGFSIEARSVLFDRNADFKMVSVSDDGGSHPLRGSAELVWRSSGRRLLGNRLSNRRKSEAPA